MENNFNHKYIECLKNETILKTIYVDCNFYSSFNVWNNYCRREKAGEAVVKVKGNTQAISVATDLDAVVIDSIPSKRTYLFKFSKARSVDEVVAKLNSNANVESATTNTTIDLPEVFQISQGFPDESEPIFNKGISPKNFYAQEGSYDIGIDSAQLISTGSNVIIAVIDNGIDYSHPLIQNSLILTGHDFISTGSDASEQPGTIYGHGTFVTGLLLLTAPDASIIPLRAFDGEGVGDQFKVAKAIDWAVRHKADIINMSFGTTEMIEALRIAIEDATNNNVVLVAASGNEGSELPFYPAAHPDVIAVASVDTLELLAGFSNYGGYLDLVAPGVNIYSALAGDYDWGTWSGTSFSAPIVSGTIAMMKQIEQGYSPAQIQDHLRNTSRVELKWGAVSVPDNQYGYGMINCYDAVAQLSIGDLDKNGIRNMTDLTIMVDYITNRNSGGNNTDIIKTEYVIPEALIDLNCDGDVNASDVAVMVHHVFVKWRDFKPCYQSQGKNK